MGVPAPPHLVGMPPPFWYDHGSQPDNQAAALYDQLFTTFNDVMTSIDREVYSGDDRDLFVLQPDSDVELEQSPHGESTERGFTNRTKKASPRANTKGQTAAVASSIISANCFAKVELYANSRLPMDLPPLKLYVSPSVT